MELTLKQQTEAFLWSFVLGAVISVIYTVVAVIRVISPPSKKQLFVSDLLFMVIAALMNFIFAVAFTEGKVRFYTIFAETISFFAIYFTVGKLAGRAAKSIFRFISTVLYKITHPVIFFVGKIILLFKEKCILLLKKVKKIKKVHLFPLHCQHKVLYNNSVKSTKR